MASAYGIRCIHNDKHYIGYTKGNLGKRMREHRCLLRAGKHKCKLLQEDWSKFGEGAFEARLLFSSDGDKRRAELYWMGIYSQEGLLYNEHIISFEPPPGAQRKAAAARVSNGYKPSAESNEKRRMAQLGKPKGHGAKISATKRAKQMMR